MHFAALLCYVFHHAQLAGLVTAQGQSGFGIQACGVIACMRVQNGNPVTRHEDSDSDDPKPCFYGAEQRVTHG